MLCQFILTSFGLQVSNNLTLVYEWIHVFYLFYVQNPLIPSLWSVQWALINERLKCEVSPPSKPLCFTIVLWVVDGCVVMTEQKWKNAGYPWSYRSAKNCKTVKIVIHCNLIAVGCEIKWKTIKIIFKKLLCHCFCFIIMYMSWIGGVKLLMLYFAQFKVFTWRTSFH